MPYNFTTIDKKWQQYWLDHKSFAALDPADAGTMPKAYVLDMFPYPSGAGLHVGHPEGYTATDIVSRHLRMKGYNVLHPMGWDAFGLPAEQHAMSTGEHPALNTQKNVDNFRRQIRMLGLSYDWDREVNTTDPKYYRWTQWIFLQLFNSYFDPVDNKAKPIAHLAFELENENLVAAPDGSIHLNPNAQGMSAISGDLGAPFLKWAEVAPEQKRDIINGQRLAYTDEVAVNWCPGLGTVLANEEVIDGRSERGNYPVERRPMRQWLLRITAYADRLLSDLGPLEWPESLKEMQRNWIGKSVGANVEFDVVPETLKRPDDGPTIEVFTTRPDTLYGATYLVLAPEHPLVDAITIPSRRDEIAVYRAEVTAKSERDRMSDTKDKTGAFTGALAINPVNGEKLPIYVADYVLMGYGTGAIMAVPAHDERDFEFAQKFKLPIRAVVQPTDEWLRDAAGRRAQEEFVDALRADYTTDAGTWPAAFTGDGVAINSGPLDGLTTSAAKDKIIAQLEADGSGSRAVTYKLRDWLFSRQRYWGEPFPILLDAQQNPYAVPEADLPVTLPPMADFRPTGTPEPPLSKAKQWLTVQTDLGVLTRETNTMPQWAGSCWYYLRYIDPDNAQRFVDPEKEKYWMPVDLYVGGVEHAVLHLLYARFWHKVLFDLGHVSTPEPFRRLINQGLILGEMEYHAFETDDAVGVSASDLKDINDEATVTGVRMIAVHRRTGQKLIGRRLNEEQVEKVGEGYRLRSDPAFRVDARSFKMSKSRGNVVNPDDIVKDYGADTFRLYEMYMGPLEAQKPWNTRDIVGMSRFLNAVWRNLVGDEEKDRVATIDPGPVPDALDRQMHRAIKKIGEDIVALRFNTAIAELIKLNNEMTGRNTIPRALAENFILLLAPFAPHIAEEIWQRLGKNHSLARHPWPAYEQAKLVETTIELPVQVNGKLRGKLVVAPDAPKGSILAAAREVESVVPWIQGKTVKKEIYVPGKLVSFVVG
jgi:leucyl-tRNA synthetase